MDDPPPLCWVESATLNRKSARCAVSREKMERGAAVYVVRYFNGSSDVNSEPTYVSRRAGDAPGVFATNKARYESDAYSLETLGYRADYRHPWINRFWKSPGARSFDDALRMIASPEVHPTPYRLLTPGAPDREGEPWRVLSGTGGEFINLLWILIKSGHAKAIVDMLPSLPAHFPAALLLFDRPLLRREVARYLDIPELIDVYDRVFQKTLSANDVAALVRFGQAHPDFQERLAQSLNLYEYHLYSKQLGRELVLSRPSPSGEWQGRAALPRGLSLRADAGLEDHANGARHARQPDGRVGCVWQLVTLPLPGAAGWPAPGRESRSSDMDRRRRDRQPAAAQGASRDAEGPHSPAIMKSRAIVDHAAPRRSR